MRSKETGNDTGMNMDTATVRIEHDIVYLYGTFHQRNELQFICPIREWTT